MQIIRKLSVRLPSMERQMAFATAAERYETVRRIGETALRMAEQAFQALLAEVFGEGA